MRGAGTMAMVSGALLLGGCGGSASTADMTFDFVSRAGDGMIDQTVDIANPSGQARAPVLRFTPLDAAGAPIPGLRVRTAYGSDRGRLVVAGRGISLDVLRFEGARKRDVEDVRVGLERNDAVADGPGSEDPAPELQLLSGGRPVDRFELFDAFTARNTADREVQARVVLIEYEQPPEGEAQQAVRTTAISPLLTLPAGGERTVRLPVGLRGRVIGSVKAHFSR